MRILIVTSVYSPELVFSAQTSTQIADEIIGQSESVTVITSFPNRPAGRIYPGYHRHLYQREKAANGYEIIRCYSSISPNSTLISRLLENLTFGITSSLAVLFSTKADAIYANTWPIFAQGLTCLVAKLRRIPIVLSIQDIYPESLTVQGRVSKSSVIYKFLCWIDQLNARWANEIIVISERFAKQYIEDRRIPAEKMHVIPNWADAEEIELIPKKKARSIHNIPEDAFIITYAGNIGAAAGVDTLIKAVGELPDKSRVLMIIAGEGSHLQHCKDLASQVSNKKIIFHSPWLSEETGSLLRASDVLLLPTQGNQSQVSVPSKMITYLFTENPILAIATNDTDIADIIRQAGCGWVIEPDNIDLLTQKISDLVTIPEETRNNMGSRGREWAIKNLSEETCLPKVIQVIESIIR